MTKVMLGQTVPDCTLQCTGNYIIQLNALRGQKVVLYFYPKDATPGCTTETQNFRDAHAQFQAKNTVILGISRDNLVSHEKFKCKQTLPFELASDQDETLCKLFDVIHEKTLFGLKVKGIQRSTFLLDEQGILRKEWRKVKVAGHIAEVLAAVDQLG